MLDIIKSIYDMMGKCTYPILKEDTPRQHVEIFFQVSFFLHLKRFTFYFIYFYISFINFHLLLFIYIQLFRIFIKYSPSQKVYPRAVLVYLF